MLLLYMYTCTFKSDINYSILQNISELPDAIVVNSLLIHAYLQNNELEHEEKERKIYVRDSYLMPFIKLKKLHFIIYISCMKHYVLISIVK